MKHSVTLSPLQRLIKVQRNLVNLLKLDIEAKTYIYMYIYFIQFKLKEEFCTVSMYKKKII